MKIKRIEPKGHSSIFNKIMEASEVISTLGRHGLANTVIMKKFDKSLEPFVHVIKTRMRMFSDGSYQVTSLEYDIDDIKIDDNGILLDAKVGIKIERPIEGIVETITKINIVKDKLPRKQKKEFIKKYGRMCYEMNFSNNKVAYVTKLIEPTEE